MKSAAALLTEYNDEKNLVIGPKGVRTGLEDFPSFKEWREEYEAEYAETHDTANPLTMEEAVALTDAELATEEELAAIAAEEASNLKEDEDMNDDDTTVAGDPEVVDTPASTDSTANAGGTKPKATKKKAAAKKATPKKKVAAKKVAAKKAPVTKAGTAQKIFDRMYPKVLDGKKKRKDIIDEFVAKANLSANGAATYYQKMKKAVS